MRRPRLQFRLRGLMILIAVVPLLVVGARQGGMWGIALGEEVEARQRHLTSRRRALVGMRESIAAKEARISTSLAQAERDQRHERWVKEAAELRVRFDRFLADHPRYERLAARPWESWSEESWGLVARNRARFGTRTDFPRSRSPRGWYEGGATVAASTSLAALLLIAWLIGNRRTGEPADPPPGAMLNRP